MIPYLMVSTAMSQEYGRSGNPFSGDPCDFTFSVVISNSLSRRRVVSSAAGGLPIFCCGDFSDCTDYLALSKRIGYAKVLQHFVIANLGNSRN